MNRYPYFVTFEQETKVNAGRSYNLGRAVVGTAWASVVAGGGNLIRQRNVDTLETNYVVTTDFNPDIPQNGPLYIQAEINGNTIELEVENFRPQAINQGQMVFDCRREQSG